MIGKPLKKSIVELEMNNLRKINKNFYIHLLKEEDYSSLSENDTYINIKKMYINRRKNKHKIFCNIISFY